MELVSYGIGIVLLVALTYLSYWRGNEVFWMVTAGVAMMVGLYSPDALGRLGVMGFGIGLALIAYSLMCIGLAYANIYKEVRGVEK